MIALLKQPKYSYPNMEAVKPALIMLGIQIASAASFRAGLRVGRLDRLMDVRLTDAQLSGHSDAWLAGYNVGLHISLDS